MKGILHKINIRFLIRKSEEKNTVEWHSQKKFIRQEFYILKNVFENWRTNKDIPR